MDKQPIKLRKILSFFLIFPILSLACAALPLGSKVKTAPTALPTLLVPVSLPAASNEQETLINLYNQINPAVVNITTYTQQGDTLTPASQGSAFLYDENRNFATNAHVVQDADQLDVIFSDGTISPGKVIGIDLNSDLAIVQAEKIPAGIVPVPLANMDQLAVGQTVVAIGNPFGLEGTLTKGIISALGRDIPALTQFSIPQSIQTDAAINPGNSGGPLLNLQGQVIGINAQIETGGTGRANTGVGFAIPVSILKRVLPDLVAKGKTEWAYLGVRGGDLNPYVVEAMKLPVEQGAYVSEITNGGPAERAGLRGSTGTDTINGRTVEVGGDVITAVDGQPIHSFDDVLIYLSLQTRPGQKVELTIVRDGNTQKVDVTLGTRPDQQ
jgi:S1-C subfamily serine protease